MELRPSIIIPARNAAAVLGECLEALEEGQQGCAAKEVIVVDDGSEDATRAIARAHGAQALVIAPQGPAAARNAGAAAASGEILVFFDADCVPQPGCVLALLAAFSDPRVSGARGAYTSRQRAIVARFAQLELEEKQDRLARSTEVTVVDTACAAYRRAIFWTYGGFDEHFLSPSAEDVDLSFRMAAGGERLVFVPDARVAHRHPESLVTYIRRKARFGYYRAGLYRRFPHRLREDGYTPRLMPVQIGLAGVLTVALTASRWMPGASWLASITGLGFLGASLPLARRAWRTDRALSLVVPVLLLARSLAQGGGLAVGLAATAVQRDASGAPVVRV